MSPYTEHLLVSLRTHPVREPWERIVADVGVSVLAREGLDGLSKVVDAPGGVDPTLLSPREMSEILVVLENAEADRLERSREILREVLAFALKAAGELLKAALGGLL